MLGDDFSRTLRKDENSVRNGYGFANVVRNKERRFLLISYNLIDVVANGKTGLVVEGGKRLVEKQYVGVYGEGSNECGALPHTARKRGRIAFKKLF